MRAFDLATPRRLVAALCATVALALAPGLARAAYPSSTFVAVDAVKVDSSQLTLTGVRLGEDAPVTLRLQVSTSTALREECQRLALLAQAKPGAYHLVVEHTAPDAYGRAYLYTCSLVRAVP